MSYPHDLRHALRSLARRPGFTLMVILTLAVGIGANATIFIFLREVAFPTLRATDEDRLFYLNTYTPETTRGASSYQDLLDYQTALGGDGEIYAWRMFGATLKLNASDEGNLFAWGEAVGPGHFALFKGQIRLGRGFHDVDARSGADRVVVLHHRFWQRRYAADPAILGHEMEINRQGYTIVGVTPKGFHSHGMTHKFYIPFAHLDDINPGERGNRERAVISALLKLRPGLTRERAEAKLAVIARGLDEAAPLAAGDRRLELGSVREGGDYYRNELNLLMVTVGLLLLLASMNVANLMLARAMERQRELAVHAAIGAGRGRLMSRLLSESLVLSLLGGALGLVLANPLSLTLEKYFIGGGVGTGAWAEGSRMFFVDQEVVLFTTLLSLLVGLVFGAVPVLHTWRLDLVAALKGGSDVPGRWRRFGVRQILVTVQVMLSVVLLLGAGLLVRSLLVARQQQPSFDIAPLLLATLYVAPGVEDGIDSTAPEKRWAELYEHAVRRLTALPGVEKATLASQVPLGGGMMRASMADSARPDEERKYDYLYVGFDFFDTLGVNLERGRSLDHRDQGSNPGAVVINRKMAETLWPGEDPLGRTLLIRQGARREMRVVGVVSDFRNRSVLQEPSPQAFTLVQGYPRLTIILRAGGPFPEVVQAVRQSLASFHPDVSLVGLATFQDQINYSMQERRMVTDTALAFGILGLLLASAGIFSVMSYTVTSRTRELGIRMAVGAASRDIRWLVLRQTLSLVFLGTAFGVLASFGLTHFLRSLLFGVEALDPMTFVTIPLLLAVTAVAAAMLPASRAARVKPTIALRQE